MALEQSDALFPDRNPRDQDYYCSFMSTIRAEINSKIYAKSTAFSYDFLHDCPFLSTHKIGFMWPRAMEESRDKTDMWESRDETDMWSCQARAGTDSEEETPKIPPFQSDEISFRNEEIGNKELLAPEEGEIGNSLPVKHKAAVGSLPFG
jgi:hypothetical protein